VIVVAGGTGRLGTQLVSRLLADGNRVRVFARDTSRAPTLASAGAELFDGDVHGFAGRGRGTPASVDHAGNVHLIDAAARVGADVILMSVVGASPDSPMVLFRSKYAAEEHVRASGVKWTIVRATAFLELWADIMRRPVVFGRGDNPVNFVSVNDVAAALGCVIAEPRYRGRVVEVGGPENLTFNELASLLNDARVRNDRIWHVPRAVLKVLAAFSRQPRAALSMDTMDMTFDSARTRTMFHDLHLTDPREALTPRSFRR
jgi:uncharacterized protein YbjT (DUF2867 family)